MNFMAYPTYKFAFIWILVALLVLSRSWGKDANAALFRPAGEMPLLTGDSLSPH
jgi:hypothetical protein